MNIPAVVDPTEPVFEYPRPTTGGSGAVSNAPRFHAISTQCTTQALEKHTPIVLISIDIHKVVVAPRIRTLVCFSFCCRLLRPVRCEVGCACRYFTGAQLHSLGFARRSERIGCGWDRGRLCCRQTGHTVRRKTSKARWRRGRRCWPVKGVSISCVHCTLEIGCGKLYDLCK